MRTGALLLGLLLAVSVQAQSLSTIKLANRPAVEVIPVVEPLLRDGEAVTGSGFVIFLRASPQTAEQVREVIAALDSPARMLQISVFQGSSRDFSEIGLGADVRVESGNTRVEIGSGRGDDRDAAGNVTFGSGSGSASISGTRTRERRQDRPIHHVRVTEGRQAYIETGQRIPYFSGIVRQSAKRRVIAGGVELEDATTGFYVLPRIQGDQVLLTVSPFRNTPGTTGGGAIDTSAASTTITGPVGEWLPIGGTSEQLERSRSGTGAYVSTQSRNSASIWIRADLVR